MIIFCVALKCLLMLQQINASDDSIFMEIRQV